MAAQGERQLFPPQQQGVMAKNIRMILLAVVAAYFFGKTFQDVIYPWGTPVDWPSRRNFGRAIDPSNDLLQSKHAKFRKIYQRVNDGQDEERLIKGTETIVLDKKGTIFAMTEEADLISVTDVKTAADGLTSTAKVAYINDLGVGRPLGADFSSDGKTLWIADAILGLTRLQNPYNPHSKVEIIANKVTLEDGTIESKFLYTNDVVVGPKTGKVYFTDSSTVNPTRVGTRTWDTLYAAKMDAFRAIPTGRVLEYDPSTDQVKVLATGFHFANGISVNGDESYLVVAETAHPRLHKYHLKGPNAGETEVLVSNITGYPDGLSCSDQGRCFAALHPIVPAHRLIAACPDTLDLMLRLLLLALPRQLAPKISPFGAILEVDANTGEYQYYLDPDGTDVAHLAGATYHNGQLYLGSLKNDYIGVFNTI